MKKYGTTTKIERVVVPTQPKAEVKAPSNEEQLKKIIAKLKGS